MLNTVNAILYKEVTACIILIHKRLYGFSMTVSISTIIYAVAVLFLFGWCSSCSCFRTLGAVR